MAFNTKTNDILSTVHSMLLEPFHCKSGTVITLDCIHCFNPIKMLYPTIYNCV